MPRKPLLIDKKDNVVTLTLNRPAKRNSLSLELIGILLKTLEDLAADDGVRTLVIRGSGDKAFCAGFDIGSLPTNHGEDAADQLKALGQVEALFKALVNFPYPVVAMVNGAAFGAGCELAICCDIRLGDEKARMGMPPAKLGIVYPWTGLHRFIQSVGLQSTRELFFTGRIYEGKRLRELGLLDYLVAAEDAESFTYQMAEGIAANAPLALKGTKRVINLLMQSGTLDKISQAEAESMAKTAFLSEDLQEGRSAFFQKRRPKFTGK
ncbi:Enoyl-CoA hydratase (EC [Olavius algarvensis Delta 1 endosymbiont]|nr:Enoyl-CoA hydratase (EC [Olavius algarvensis Delta 1 endosymbiont]